MNLYINNINFLKTSYMPLLINTKIKSTDQKILIGLLAIKEVINKQISINKKGIASEVSTVLIGGWETFWGLLETLYSGIGLGFLVSKIAYTLTSGEESLSSLYLSKSFLEYEKFLKAQIILIDKLIIKINNNSKNFSPQESFLIKIALNGNYKEATEYKGIKKARKSLTWMHGFNAIILFCLTIITFLGRNKGQKSFRLPFVLAQKYHEPINKLRGFKDKIFTSIFAETSQGLIKKPAEFVEALSISLPMLILSAYKFYLSKISESKIFSQIQFAQGLAHIACGVEGALNAYQALFVNIKSKLFEILEKLLVLFNFSDYLFSTKKLISHNRQQNHGNR